MQQKFIEQFNMTTSETQSVLGSLLFKSNSLHITLYFKDDLCISYILLRNKSNYIILSYSYILLRNKVTINILSYMHLEMTS